MAKAKTNDQDAKIPGAPQAGGSYVRKPDGSLELVERTAPPGAEAGLTGEATRKDQ